MTTTVERPVRTAPAPPPAARLRRPTWRDPRLLVGVVVVALSVALGAQDRNYPFDPVLGALLFRSVTGRLPQLAQDLPDPLSDSQTLDLIVACLKRGFTVQAQ